MSAKYPAAESLQAVATLATEQFDQWQRLPVWVRAIERMPTKQSGPAFTSEVQATDPLSLLNKSHRHERADERNKKDVKKKTLHVTERSGGVDAAPPKNRVCRSGGGACFNRPADEKASRRQGRRRILRKHGRDLVLQGLCN